MAKRGRKPKLQDVPKELQMSLQEFLNSCYIPHDVVMSGDIITLKNATITNHIYLHQYKIDIFNYLFARILIYKNENIIRIWDTYGEKRKVEQENGEFCFKQFLGKPRFVIRNMLTDLNCPEKNDDILEAKKEE